MEAFEAAPVWYWIVAGLWSAYQGARGVAEHAALGTYRCDFADKPIGSFRRFVLVFLHDFVFRAVCTLAGFVALWMGWYVIDQYPLDGARLGAVAALLTIGVIGVGGQLHYVILLGKLGKS